MKEGTGARKPDRKGRTSTSAFGAGRRESHDASDFYARFAPPELTHDDSLETPRALPRGEDACINSDSRDMCLADGDRLVSNSVALVVTSPPYFSGKEYEQALGQGHVPGSYVQYLAMLRDVFSECKRVMEPGGRIAVNVANLGRKPYRSLSGDVVRILQDDLGLLLRGEIIWKKGEGASGSCAWGSFRSAANPVLRDVTERVVIASKGRFDRAGGREKRRALGLPHESEVSADEFMAATLDVWEIAPESARKVKHPAPFPVELPQRLMGLYTYRGDLVVDPFMGSGTTMVAAARSGRRYLGYDTDPVYVTIAKQRVREELARLARERGRGGREEAAARARAEPKTANAVAGDVLAAAGFRVVAKASRLPGLGTSVDVVATDAKGARWYFDVAAAFTSTRGGLGQTGAVWASLGRAAVMSRNGKWPVVLLTSELPRAGSDGERALRAAGPGVVFDIVELLSDNDRSRLGIYAAGGHEAAPEPGFWGERELAGT